MFGHVARVRAHDAQRGETLVELMVTIVLMSTGIIAVITGLFSLATTADYNHEVTQASLMAQSYAEQLEQPVPSGTATTLAGATSPSTYIPCATPPGGAGPHYPDFNGPGALTDNRSAATNYTVKIVQIDYLQGANPVNAGFGNTCVTAAAIPATATSPAVASHDNGLQRIYIEAVATSPNRPDKELVVIMKRDASCPSQIAFPNPDQGPC